MALVFFIMKGGSLPHAPAPLPPIVKPALSGLILFYPAQAGLPQPLLAGAQRRRTCNAWADSAPSINSSSIYWGDILVV